MFFDGKNKELSSKNEALERKNEALKAESLGLDLSELNKEQLKSVDENLDENAIKFLDLHASKEARTSKGGTSNKSVEEQIKILDDWLK